MGRAAYAEIVAKRREVTALWRKVVEARRRAAVAQRELELWRKVVEARRRAAVAQRELDRMLLAYDPGGPGEVGAGFPTIVCLCGSTRFSDAFRKAALDETLAGRIVLSIGCDMKDDNELFGHLDDDQRVRIKSGLDELHLRKIDLAHEVFILNVGGYVGESTRREVLYARMQGKCIRWLEPDIPADLALTGE